MHSLSIRLLLALAVIVAGSAFAISQNSSEKQIAFTVSMTKPHTHLFEVDVRIRNQAGASPRQETLVMPVWTPGSYLIREFERHVQDFSASDSAGNALSWEKTNKNSWRVTTNGAREWHATYRVYANELSVRTSELNSEHAFWNNANLLMYVEGRLQDAATLKVNAAPGWQVATGLPAVKDEANTFRAPNFDVLYDSPVEASDFKVISFEVNGVPHRIVIDGEGNYDPVRVQTDVKKIVEAEVTIMGGEIPYHDYTFFLHLRSSAGGGLEHLNSTALGYPRYGFKITEKDRSTSAAPVGDTGERDYRGFLSLVSHEFFHLWNVKRIRPDALGPFDYTKENYTKVLWVAEGITDYYADVALRRAGLITDEEFLKNSAKAFQGLQETPGRKVQSVEEASYDAWIKFYRPDENSVNSQVSYYDKGAILGLLLDLEIRRSSKGAKSLDDVMRYLYAEFFKKNRNYSPQDFQKACELAAGGSLEQFFAHYVRATEELDFERALNGAGLHLDTSGGEEVKVSNTFFGADLKQDGDRLLVTKVYAGSPAYDQGVNANDQIVALDNQRVTKEFLLARLAEKQPGNIIRLTIFRFDDLKTLELKLGPRGTTKYRIIATGAPTVEQKQVYESWLAAPFPKSH